MDIIYSASALGAFSGSLIYIVIFFILGFGNLLLLLLPRRRKKRKIGDYVVGFISILIIFFGLEKEIWEKVEVNSCYQFTYYPIKPLLADYLQQEDPYPNLYETTGYITLIEKTGC